MKSLMKLVLLAVLTGMLCGCTLTTKEPITRTDYYFDTIITITLYDSQKESLLDHCFEFCYQFEQLISRTIPTSDISRINSAEGKPVAVSDITIELLKEGIAYGEQTQGMFDITIAPLSTLWDIKNNPGKIPSDQDIAEAVSHVNYKNIIIEGNTVTLKDPKAAIDLGGIAKGYVADYLKEYLICEGVQSALINLGGNVLTIGNKPDGTSFQIGIQRPFEETNVTIKSVSIKDSSIVTSGSYERYFEKNGRIYHHILDPFSGYPAENDLLSVTILSEDSVSGDALSTSCFLLGLDEGIQFINSLKNIDAIFVTTDYEIVDTRK